MALKVLIFCVVFAIFKTAQSQCLNRFPNCNQNFIPFESIPNQILYNQPMISQPIIADPCDTIIPGLAAPTTIIQDSTVANNLANALQLLVVSSLLSNTLPNCNPYNIPILPGGPIIPPCGKPYLSGPNIPPCLGNVVSGPVIDQLGPAGSSPYYVF